MLGEDAQQSRHKDVRYYREHNNKKMAWKQTNEDLTKMLLVSSDPVISNIKSLAVRQNYSLPTEVLNLSEKPGIISDEDEE